MENSSKIEELVQFGLTRQEAAIYMAIMTLGEITGYEAAKHTGISRSNAYNALAGLVEKGAAYIIEGTVTKYTPVSVEEFCLNKIHTLEETMKSLIKDLPVQQIDCEGYITIEGEKHIINKIKNMLSCTEKRVYLSLPDKLLEYFRKDLEVLIEKEIKVVIISGSKIELEGAVLYIGEKNENQIRMITDSNYVLTGEFGVGQDFSCLYSGKKNFVDIFKESLRNEIRLIELTGGETKK